MTAMRLAPVTSRIENRRFSQNLTESEISTQFFQDRPDANLSSGECGAMLSHEFVFRQTARWFQIGLCAFTNSAALGS
jgi:hypothetical protein